MLRVRVPYGDTGVRKTEGFRNASPQAFLRPFEGGVAAHRVSGQGRINRLIVKRLDGEFSTAWD
jgi:hypothetical protein